MPTGVLKGLASLASLMTRLPVGGGSLEDAGRFFYLVPVIGLVTGALSWIPSTYSTLATSMPSVGGAAYVASYLIVTGCIHIDGLADFMDAALSGARGVNALRIMKDSRRGSFAVAWVSCILIISYALSSSINSSLSAAFLDPITCLKYSAILSLTGAWSAEGMYAAACVGRTEPYDGMARYFTEYSSKPSMVLLNVLTVASISAIYYLCLRVNPYLIIASLTASVITGLSTGLWGNRLLGFVNGDVLGTASELSRVSALTAFLAFSCAGMISG